MKKMTVVVMFITILSKVLGFIRDITLSSNFGFGAVSDSFTLAITIPNSVLSIIGAVLVTGIIPMLTRILNEDEDRANRFTSNILNIMLLFCMVMMVLMFVLPEFVIFLFASNLSHEAMLYAVPFLRVIAFGIFSIAIVQLGSGYLNVKKNFIIPALVSIPSNVIVIVAIIIANKSGNTLLLAYGQLAALIFQAAVIFIYMKKMGFDYRAVIDLNDKDLRLMVTLALPLLLSAVLGQLNDIIMKNFATVLVPVGGYSYMSYATKLIGFVSGIFITAILNVSYPTIAQNVVNNDNKRLNKSINDAILMIFVFVTPAVVGFITLARPIIEFVFLSGEVTASDVNIIVPIFVADALVLLAMGMRELLFRIHYAYHDMKSPVRNTVFVTIVFIIGLIIFPFLFGKLGHPLAGLSFSYSVAALIAVVPLFKSAKKLIGKTYFKYIVKDMTKILLSALVMGVFLLLVKGPLLSVMPGRIGTLVAIVGAGIVYIVALIALRTRFALSLLSSVLFKETN
ncbi:murein biosynthesis integral membrane protein MurJ [Erysipelothrix aquatica]|uniref:murein biosynthesis integral membrane protein MurJ n=1 Tax=Erysipelothrix aquatica TaxID=2683714 RepID=UPI001359FFB4|nr:murein biosynthesis integral membrane protein MurJ [Erysipelothrix aquatica]